MCYNKKNCIYGVKIMENEHLDEVQQEENTYTPRPAWQVWCARIGLVLFIIVLILYYLQIIRGGV